MNNNVYDARMLAAIEKIADSLFEIAKSVKEDKKKERKSGTLEDIKNSIYLDE